MPESVNTNSVPFGQAWSRGWKVVFMLIVIQIAGWLISLPIHLLPEGAQNLAALALGLLLGPPLCYWVFMVFYPQAETSDQSRRQTAFAPTVCFSCTAAIPPGSSTCPACGWSFKPNEPSSA